MLVRIERIQRTVAGIDFKQLAADDDKVDAIMANFMILGEAAHAVPVDVQLRYPAIAWLQMWNTRNRLIHGYADVNLEIIWKTAERDLPPLVPLLQQLLEREAGC